MVILPNPCSIKLQTNNNPFSTPGLASIGTGKHLSQIAIISTLKTSYQTKSLDRFINDNNNPVLQESYSLRRRQLFDNQILTTKDFGENEGKSGHSSKLKTKQNDEALGKEVESVICRLKAVVERVRELEIQKLIGRFKGTKTMSDEDRLMVEISSREIVDKFLKRPVQYLTSGNGDFEEKLKDLNLLIRMLEKSCLEVCQR